MKKLNQNENILIGYTKWLLKWVLMLVIFVGLAMGSFFGYEAYQNSPKDIFFMECELVTNNFAAQIRMTEGYKKDPKDYEKTLENTNILGGKRFFKATKKTRNNDELAWLYRPAKQFINEKEKTFYPFDYFVESPDRKFLEIYGIKKDSSLYYLYDCAPSKCKLGKSLTTINRKTLEFNVYFFNETPAITRSCKKISEHIYSQEEKKVLDKYFKDYKI